MLFRSLGDFPEQSEGLEVGSSMDARVVVQSRSDVVGTYETFKFICMTYVYAKYNENAIAQTQDSPLWSPVVLGARTSRTSIAIG